MNDGIERKSSDMADAVAADRERCTQLVEAFATKIGQVTDETWLLQMLDDLVTKIRNRTN